MGSLCKTLRTAPPPGKAIVASYSFLKLIPAELFVSNLSAPNKWTKRLRIGGFVAFGTAITLAFAPLPWANEESRVFAIFVSLGAWPAFWLLGSAVTRYSMERLELSAALGGEMPTKWQVLTAMLVTCAVWAIGLLVLVLGIGAMFYLLDRALTFAKPAIVESIAYFESADERKLRARMVEKCVDRELAALADSGNYSMPAAKAAQEFCEKAVK